MKASIEYLSFSPLPIVEDDDWRRPGQRLHCRLKVQHVNPEQPLFDDVRISLQGAVRTRIGDKQAVKSILDMTKQREWSEFGICSSPKDPSTSESFVDVGFCVLPQVDANDASESSHSFTPPLDIAGSTYITRSDVISNQQRVDGECEVLYWLAAKFRLQERVIKCFKCALDFSKLSTPIRLTVSTKLPSTVNGIPVVPRTWPLVKRGWPVRAKRINTPELSLSLPAHLGSYIITIIEPDCRPKHQLVDLPLEVSMQIPPNCPASEYILHHGIPKCSVEALWHRRRSFCTGNFKNSSSSPGHPRKDPFTPSQSNIRISDTATKKHKSNISFPPFYQDLHEAGQYNCERGANLRPQRYSAVALLGLLLPQDMTVPTVNTDLLKISYELEIHLTIDEEQCAGNGKRRANLVVPCEGTMKIPILVVAS